MQQRFCGPAIFSLLVVLTGAPAHADCALADLRWMAGVWQYHQADNQVEERWIVTPAGQLMGSSWSMHFTSPNGSAEASTIAAEGGAVKMRLRHFDLRLDHAVEDKDAPMIFAASSCQLDKVVFEGEGARTGERITYIRAGDSLTFIGDFLHQGTPLHVEQKFLRAGA